MRWLALLLLVACSRGAVSYVPRFPGDQYAAAATTEVLFAEPTRLHVEIGVVTVRGQWDDAAMVERLRARAGRAGADAIILPHPLVTDTGGQRRIEAVAIRYVGMP